ncbi:Wzt carbohydrate-binding domain-containing protein [Duganella sp. S19_KUP01_CR8]|uniref:Wzt carbohydrate-binding domain-containing protein n=1 Tax=Duganella sp. S19_KUP01_CR8 TaxID=3025502 RepID=UPI002FCDA580
MPQLKAYPGRIIFDHLPKTGGSAVARWLARGMGSGCVSPHIDDEHQSLIRRHGGQYSVLCAHVSYLKAEGLDPRYSYATLLREPIDRILSSLYFALTNHGDHQLWGLVPLVRRFLDSDGADLAERLLPHVSNTYVEHFCRIDGDGTEDPPTRLRNALAALQRYEVVGVYDQLESFLASFGALLEQADMPQLERVNATVSRPGAAQVSPALRARLLELNQLDLQLYQAARAIAASRPAAATATASRWQHFERAPAYSVQTGDLAIAQATLREHDEITAGGSMHFDLELTAARRIPQLLLGIHIKDSDGRLVYGVHSGMLGALQDGLDAGRHRLSYSVTAALPAGRYTAGFAVVEVLKDGQRDLAWHDSLCAFEVQLPAASVGMGYADLSAQLLTNAAPPVVDAAIRHAPGALLAHTPLPAMRCKHRYRIAVDLRHDGAETWHGDGPRPVMLSYHWLRPDGVPCVYDGVRTPLPAAGVAPGERLAWHVDVDAPAAPGAYQLVLTALQENVAWFENLGFEPARLALQAA